MAKTIQQTVSFNVPVSRLFRTYVDSKAHAKATGAPSAVSRKAGGRFTAFDGMVTGTTLAVIPQKLFVQTWRGSDWKRGVPDSILFLMFDKKGKGSTLTMIHANVPDFTWRRIKQGWNDYYWNKWRAHFKNGKP
jgi:activator of HSP90 ATPase